MPTRKAMVDPVLKEDGTPYKVAILIPTINNADELAIVLDRLTQQTYPDIEIVISDSKSRDHTKDVCEKYGATWIEDPSTNRADACNFALKQMDHDLVLFTDDDTIPPRTGLRSSFDGSKIQKLEPSVDQILPLMKTHLERSVPMLPFAPNS